MAMAIYSLHLGVISRSVGGKKRKDGSRRKTKKPRSCQVAAAYKRAGSVTVAGRTWNYSRKKDVIHLGVYLPHGSHPISSETLWIMADAAEKRKDAATAREGHAALPIECSAQERAAIIHEFALWMCETHKVAFDANYHNEDGNPHLDFQFTVREYLPDGGLGAKTRCLDDQKTGAKLVEHMRSRWAAICNRQLEKYGVTIDHRSYARQGIEKLPQIHLGQAAGELEGKGVRTERGDHNLAVRQINREQEEIRIELQRLREDENHDHSRTELRPDAQGVTEEVFADRQTVCRGFNALSTKTSGGAEAVSAGSRCLVGQNPAAGLFGTPEPVDPAGKSQQGATAAVGRDRRVSPTPRSTGKDGGVAPVTAGNILRLLHRTQQNIVTQVDVANQRALAGYRLLPSMSSTANGILKNIRLLSAEVWKAVGIVNLKALGGLHHGTEKTSQDHRGAGKGPDGSAP